MFGFKFAKFQPTVYALRYKNGKVVQAGNGLSFFYYAPTTSLVAVPVSSSDAPFMFEESTADYQAVTIQGQVTYRISDAQKTAAFLNYTLDSHTQKYVSDDPQKLSQRILNVVQVLAKKEISSRPLRETLRSIEAVTSSVGQGIQSSSEMAALGVETIGLSILAIKPNKETARALEAEAREKLLKESDDAIYTRRNFALEQERRIKENELNTEIAVEVKRRQIRETQMDAEQAVLEKKQQLDRKAMEFSVSQENRRQELVKISTANSKAESDAKAYSVSALMTAIESAPPAVVQALMSAGMPPQHLIAQAFQGLAEKADKIGQLNITPDLLRELLNGE
jgi:hypothetical protein